MVFAGTEDLITKSLWARSTFLISHYSLTKCRRKWEAWNLCSLLCAFTIYTFQPYGENSWKSPKEKRYSFNTRPFLRLNSWNLGRRLKASIRLWRIKEVLKMYPLFSEMPYPWLFFYGRGWKRLSSLKVQLSSCQLWITILPVPSFIHATSIFLIWNAAQTVIVFFVWKLQVLVRFWDYLVLQGSY